MVDGVVGAAVGGAVYFATLPSPSLSPSPLFLRADRAKAAKARMKRKTMSFDKNNTADGAAQAKATAPAAPKKLW